MFLIKWPLPLIKPLLMILAWIYFYMFVVKGNYLTLLFLLYLLIDILLKGRIFLLIDYLFYKNAYPYACTDTPWLSMGLYPNKPILKLKILKVKCAFITPNLLNIIASPFLPEICSEHLHCPKVVLLTHYTIIFTHFLANQARCFCLIL